VSTRTVRINFIYNGNLTDASSAVLAHQTENYGVKRNDLGTTVVAKNTVLTKVTTGQYEHTFTEPAAGLSYTAWVKFVYGGNTYYEEVDLAPVAGTWVGHTFETIRVEIADYLGLGRNTEGAGSEWTVASLARLAAIIKDGANQVYYPMSVEKSGMVHEWSWMHPVSQITTSAPYETGTVTVVDGVVTLAAGTFPSWAADGEVAVDGGVYKVATRDDDTHVTLTNTDVQVSAGTDYHLLRPQYSLPEDFVGLDGGAMTFFPAQASGWPGVCQVSDLAVRAARQQSIEAGRPRFVAIRPDTVDGTAKQAWLAVFMPTPDAAYTLELRYSVRPPLLSASYPYPLGGLDIGGLILESCLAVAEQRYMDGAGPHSQVFAVRLAAAVARDAAQSTPDSLGFGVADSYSLCDCSASLLGDTEVPFDGVVYRDHIVR
jgi:hypothetical protein